MSNTNRKRLRLENYDYASNGVYYATICTKNKQSLLCKLIPGPTPMDEPTTILTDVGKIVDEATRKIPGIDKYVIMPNHVHMIVFQEDGKSFSTKIRLWKTVIAAKCGQGLWQSSYNDRVLRSEREYQIKWKYIDDNPIKWAADDYYSPNEED